MRAVVFAYHEIGFVCLEELLRFGVDVGCLFTHEDDPGEEVWFRKPKEIAREKNIPVHTPENLKEGGWIELIRSLEPDFIFSFYYRKMIPKAVLDIPRVAALNLHGSLLPRFRGRCPVNWVLIEGEEETGMSLHFMLEKPDAGDLVAQKTIPIAFEDTAHTLFLKMAAAARDLMREVLPALNDGTFARVPQTGPSSYYGGRKPEDGLITWQKDAWALYNLVRATTHPYPGAFTFLDGRKLFIWQAAPEEGGIKETPGTVVSGAPFLVATGRGRLRLLRVQYEGEEETDGPIFASTHDVEGKYLGGEH